ncbi:hypothetical protein [Nocardia sp. NPDC057440]|uniref:hypothetical protein n=1 Tax=Nocardia sp. NPDC057440 TaxID=3346134 RepID=UPI00366B4B1C
MLYLVDGRVAPPDVLVQTARGWVEPAPTRCPAGHVLRAGEFSVGWVPCMTDNRSGHRTHECPCGAIVYTPPCDVGCDHEAATVTPANVSPVGGPDLDMAHLFGEQPKREPDDD